MRFDLLLSTWIFIWFVLFGFKMVRFNPSLILILSFALVAFEVVILKYYGIQTYDLVKFIIVNVIFIKLLPLISLALNGDLLVTLQDTYFTIFLVMIYTLYLYANHINAYNYYKVLADAYVKNEDKPISKSPVNEIYNNTYDYIYAKIIQR
jgi:hypothetical protein